MRPTNCLAWAACELGKLVNAEDYADIQKDLDTILRVRDLHIGDVCKYFTLSPLFRYGAITNTYGEVIRVDILPLRILLEHLDEAPGILIGESHAALLNDGKWFDVKGDTGTLEQWEVQYKVVSVWLLV
jgi:hypothetical protein